MMDEPGIFSPFKPSVRAGAPIAAHVQGNRFLDDLLEALTADAAFYRFIARLTAMCPEERAAELRSIGFWRDDLKGSDRAKVIKMHRPELFDRQVAELARVARETLGRDPAYLSLKRVIAPEPPKPDKWRGRTRRRIDEGDIEDDDGPED